jgi:hypothetical protein
LLSFAVYKVVHFLGIFMLVTALAATLARSAKEGLNSDPLQKRLGLVHGVALLLILVGGFGMLARLDAGFPGWAIAKMVIWIVFGGMINLRKNPSMATWGLVVIPILAALAGWIAFAKPF